MMTKQAFVTAVLRDMKQDEWKLLGGEIKCDELDHDFARRRSGALLQ